MSENQETETKKTRKPRQKKSEVTSNDIKKSEERVLSSTLESTARLGDFCAPLISYTPMKEITVNEELFDWKSLIPAKYIEISSEWLSKNGIDPSKFEAGNKEELQERCGEENLIIRLAGFKHLAHIRGLKSVSYDIRTFDKERVSAVCNLRFTECQLTKEDGSKVYFPEQEFHGVANANIENTSYPFSNFLESMAENRAFIRAVKTALNINILGAEELEIKQIAATNLLSDDGCVSPQESLGLMLAGIGKSFTDLKINLKNKKWENHEDWNDFSDIPSDQCLLIIDGIRAKL